MKIFDDSSDDDEEPTIEIDKAFERRFEHNKRREELDRYKELQARGLAPADSDDEDEEEEDYDDVNAGRSKKELKFFEALIKVKKQDPSLKNEEVILFSDAETDENEKKEEEKKKKPMYLKDVVATHLLDEGADFGEDEEEEQKEKDHRGKDDMVKSLVYDEEQERIRREFLEAAEKEEDEKDVKDDGELLKVKEKIAEETDSDDEELKKKVDEYFDDEADENAKFLKEYFVNKMWIEKPGAIDVPALNDNDLDILSEDEELSEKEEEFEYRYQENVGDRVLGHARNVEDTVRKVEKKRKLQRKSKEERMAAAKLEREEELRHMKNLKKKEINNRVRRIMEVAGLNSDEVVPMSARELESEFDPDEYDRMMKKAFGDEYYDAEVGVPEEDSDDDDEAGKPNFDEEDEKLGLEKGWDGRDAMAAIEGPQEEEDEEEEAIKEEEDEKKRKKMKSAMVEKAKQEWLDEYFKLDYEDTIDGLKTRFRYGKTKRNRYGLSAAEILAMDDKELSQYVPLKKIALYKEEEYKVPESKRYEIKLKAKEALRNIPRAQDHKSDGKKKKKKNKNKVYDEESSEKKKNKKKKSKEGDEEEEQEEEEPSKKRKRKEIGEDKPSSSDAVSGEEGEPGKLSKTAKRRKNRNDRKLSESRLKAYLKIEPRKSKKKAKY